MAGQCLVGMPGFLSFWNLLFKMEDIAQFILQQRRVGKQPDQAGLCINADDIWESQVQALVGNGASLCHSDAVAALMGRVF